MPVHGEGVDRYRFWNVPPSKKSFTFCVASSGKQINFWVSERSHSSWKYMPLIPILYLYYTSEIFSIHLNIVLGMYEATNQVFLASPLPDFLRNLMDIWVLHSPILFTYVIAVVLSIRRSILQLLKSLEKLFRANNAALSFKRLICNFCSFLVQKPRALFPSQKIPPILVDVSENISGL